MKNINYKSTLHACYLGYITQALIVNLPPLLFVIFKDADSYSLNIGLLMGMIFPAIMLIGHLILKPSLKAET